MAEGVLFKNVLGLYQQAVSKELPFGQTRLIIYHAI